MAAGRLFTKGGCEFVSVCVRLPLGGERAQHLGRRRRKTVALHRKPLGWLQKRTGLVTATPSGLKAAGEVPPAASTPMAGIAQLLGCRTRDPMMDGWHGIRMRSPLERDKARPP